MAAKDYEGALDAYTAALQLCPAGPSSHVFFSNRAAALCYLERYEEAEMDSERSLALVPDYGKAHARLGLSRFFLGDYAGAVEAYESALRYDPDNAASRSYLEKARARMEMERSEEDVEDEHDDRLHDDERRGGMGRHGGEDDGSTVFTRSSVGESYVTEATSPSVVMPRAAMAVMGRMGFGPRMDDDMVGVGDGDSITVDMSLGTEMPRR